MTSDELRGYVRLGLKVVKAAVQFTDIAVDDKIVAFLDAVVEDDESWAAFYAIFEASEDGDIVVGSPIAGFDISVIVAVVKLILEIIKILRGE